MNNMNNDIMKMRFTQARHFAITSYKTNKELQCMTWRYNTRGCDLNI